MNLVLMRAREVTAEAVMLMATPLSPYASRYIGTPGSASHALMVPYRASAPALIITKR